MYDFHLQGRRVRQARQQHDVHMYGNSMIQQTLLMHDPYATFKQAAWQDNARSKDLTTGL
jgi:hypothetical protein